MRLGTRGARAEAQTKHERETCFDGVRAGAICSAGNWSSFPVTHAMYAEGMHSESVHAPALGAG